MAVELQARLEALRADLGPRAAALGLELVLPVPPRGLSLVPAAASWADRSLRALAEAVIARARQAGGKGRLALALGLTASAGSGKLRVLADDTLPGLPESQQAAAFAALAGEQPPPQPDSLRLGALIGEAGLAELDFLSHPGGNLLWAELPLAAGGPPGPSLLGWSRRARLDRQDLLRRLGGDQRIAALVIASFREDAPRQLAALATALGSELEEALRIAHSLKGAARNTGGFMLGEVAAALETALRQQRAELARACLPRLRWELDRLEAAWPASPR
jgi:HPt (histidine-containing phosphotransfer) domain-containing protein